MNNIITIDTLDLEGMTPSEGDRAARAFTQELEALLTENGLPEGADRADISAIDLGDLAQHFTAPEAVGRELARALYTELAP